MKMRKRIAGLWYRYLKRALTVYQTVNIESQNVRLIHVVAYRAGPKRFYLEKWEVGNKLKTKVIE